MKHAVIISLLGAAALSGCVSLNGLSDSKSSFACKAPDGVACTSVSGVYANAQQDNLPALQAYRKSALPSVTPPTGAPASLPVALPGMPIRSQPRVMRIWMAPWVDEDGALHDQSFMYVVVDPGKWLIERSREATVQKTLTRLRPLGQPHTSTAATAVQFDSAPDQGAQAAAVQAAVVPDDKEQVK